MRGTARQVVERMDIMEEVRQAHTSARGMTSVNSQGKRLASMGTDLLGDSGGVIAEIEILRGDLVRILNAATRADIEYIFGDTITSIEQGESGVHVTFQHGAPQTFDLVVGADGLHSNVRRLVFGPEAQFVRDMGAYVAIFTAPNHLDLDGWQLMYGIPKKNGGKTASLYPLLNPAEAKAMFIFAAQPLHYDYHEIEQQKKIVAQAFAGEGWEIPRMLEARRDAPDFYFDRVCQIQMDCWARGRAVLLGDAGYCGSPMGGNGSSMALVGAYVLAGELATANGDYATAFARYECEMRDYVTRCQKFAQSSPGFLLPKLHVQHWLVLQLTRMLPYMPGKGMIADGFQKTANSVTLKDYPKGALAV